jgi:hypothetical protein
MTTGSICLVYQLMIRGFFWHDELVVLAEPKTRTYIYLVATSQGN